MQEVLFQRQILNKLLGGKYNKIGIIHEDKILGAIHLTRNPQISQRPKHIDMRHHFVRNLVEKRIIKIRFIKSEDNIANIFTKNVKEETKKQTHKGNSQWKGKIRCIRKW